MGKSFRERVLVATLSFGLTAGVAAPALAETLAEAIAEAYQNNPTIQAQRAQQRAIDEEYVQARTGWRPTLSLQANAIWQETRIPDRAIRFTDPGPIARGNSGSAGLTFTQPIWTGGRAAAAVSAANADVLQGRENLRRIENQVIASVIQAYADVQRDQAQLEIQQKYATTLAAQLKEAQARFDVGEVTRTDVAQAQQRLAGGQTQVQNLQAQLAIDRATYAALVGHNPGTLAPLPSLDYLMPVTVDDAFMVAEQNSPILRGQQFAEQASRARIASARAQRMPQVSLQASGAFNGAPIGPFDQGLYRREAQAAVTFNMPLFSGGLTSSQVRQAIERNNTDRITVETQRRAVLQTITQTWNQLVASRSNVTTTQSQVRAATIEAAGMHEEYRVGLRSTFDVLQAEQELSSAKINQVNAERDQYISTANMLAAMGRLEARNLIPSEPQYDPKANYRRLRFTWGWVPWEEPIGVLDRFLTAPPIPQSRELPREPAIGGGLQAQPPAVTPAPPPAS